jgi:hypothetical protein
MAVGRHEPSRPARRGWSRGARGLAILVVGAAACSEGGAEEPAPLPARPAPRALGDPFCVEPPAIQGDLRPVWSVNLEGPQVVVTAMAADSDGGVFAGGLMVDRLKVGSLVVSGALDGLFHPFVLRVDEDGSVRWGKVFPSSWLPLALRATRDHGVDVLGMDEGVAPVDFGDGPIPGRLVIGTFDAGGELGGARSLDPGYLDIAMPPAIGPGGEIALTEFNSGIAVFDATGTPLWEKPMTSLVQGLFAFDAGANLVAAAAFYNGIDWVDPPLEVQGVEGVIAKFDPAGGLQWLRRLGREIVPFGLSAAGGRALITTHQVERQEVTVTSLADGSGTEPVVVWSRPFPIDMLIGAPVLAAALADGAAFVFGGTDGFNDFGLGAIPRPGAYLARLDGTGATAALAVFDGQQPFPMQLAVDTMGSAYLAGGFLNVIDAGGGPLRGTSMYGTGTFLAKVARGPAAADQRRCGVSRRPGVVLGDPLPFFATGIAIAGETVALTNGTEVLSVGTTGGEPRFLASREPGTVALAADAKSIYWANAGTDTGKGDPLRDGGIRSAPIGGGPVNTLVGGLAGVAAMAIDNRNLYFAVGPVRQGTSVTLGKLMSIPLEGGSPRQLAAGFIDIGPLAARGGEVMLAGRTAVTGSLNILRIDGAGEMDTLAISDRKVAGLVADDEAVYWVEYADFDTGRVGQLRSVPLGGGSSRVLAGPLDAPSGLAVVGGDVYYNVSRREGMDLVRLPAKAGDRPSTLARGFAWIGPLASDESQLAWVERTDDITWALIVQRP